MMRNILVALCNSALLRCARGATAVEYGLILALIVLAIMAAVQQFANKANGMWGNVANAVNKT